MSKIFKRCLSAILVACVSSQLVTSVFAEPYAETQSDVTVETQSEVNEAEELTFNNGASAEILEEDIEKRTENTKYFIMSDGSTLAAEYAYPVHYKETPSDAEWVDIDNSLIEEKASSYTESKNSSNKLKNKKLVIKNGYL